MKAPITPEQIKQELKEALHHLGLTRIKAVEHVAKSNGLTTARVEWFLQRAAAISAAYYIEPTTGSEQ